MTDVSTRERKSAIDLHLKLTNLLAKHQQQLKNQISNKQYRFWEQDQNELKVPFPTKELNYLKSSESNNKSSHNQSEKISFRKMLQTHLLVDPKSLTENFNIVQRNPDFLKNVLEETNNHNLPPLKIMPCKFKVSFDNIEKTGKLTQQNSERINNSKFFNFKNQDEVFFSINKNSLEIPRNNGGYDFKNAKRNQNELCGNKSSLKSQDRRKYVDLEGQLKAGESTNSKILKKSVAFLGDFGVLKPVKKKSKFKFSFFCCGGSD